MIILRDKNFSLNNNAKGSLTIQDVFYITGQGTTVTGLVGSGIFKVGDKVEISDNNGYKKTISIKRLQVFRNLKDQVGAGENVGIVLGDIPKGELKRGMLVKSI